MAHLFPQLPQLAGSLSTLAQAPLAQRNRGSLHVQVALLHVSSVAHAALHLPQLALSRERSMQAPLQFESPALQVVEQVPLLQTLPASQTRAQPPQFFGSLLSFTHAAPQRISPAGQVVGTVYGVQRAATQA